MTIRELHYQFLLAKDSVDALKRHTFTPVQIDWLLNDAQIRLVRAKTSGENEQQLGYEQTQKLADEFSTLHIKFPLQNELQLIPHDGIYELDLSTLKYPYLRFLRGNVEVNFSEDCRQYTRLRFIQSDDVDNALRDPFNSPAIEFIPYNFGRASKGTGSSLYIYPGIYTLGKVKPEYLKYPSLMSLGTYTNLNGIIIPEQTSELPEEMHHKIVDRAVELASVYIMDPSAQFFHQSVYSYDS